MAKIKLLNSAMMPQPGTYCMTVAIPPRGIKTFIGDNDFDSYIGYEETAAYLASIIGRPVPVSRAATTLEDGDVMIICRPKYRVADPATKGKFTPGPDDYELFICWYDGRR